MKVLFLCEGNMIRSPMAAAFYNTLTGSHDAHSAGAAEHLSGGPAPDVVGIMSEKGITLDYERKTLSRSMVDAADIVVAFPTPYMPDFVLKDSKTRRWDIRDPYYQPRDGQDYLRHAGDRIEELVRGLVEEVAA